MENTRTVPMNKYIIWTSPTSGEYVRADRVEEFDGKLIFIRTAGVVDKVVKDYQLKDIVNYHKVKE